MSTEDIELNEQQTHFNLNQLCKKLNCKPQRILISKAFNERLVEIAVNLATKGRYVRYKDLVISSKGRKSVTFVHLDFLSLCQKFSVSRRMRVQKKGRTQIGHHSPEAPPNTPEMEVEFPERDLSQEMEEEPPSMSYVAPQSSLLPSRNSLLPPLVVRTTSDRLPQKTYPSVRFPWQK